MARSRRRKCLNCRELFVPDHRNRIQTRYPSLADYEKIDAEMDNDEKYLKLLEPIIENSGEVPVDQFYRVIQG